MDIEPGPAPMGERDAAAQTEFLLAAIGDARDVIRAIDTKVGALFFGLSIPLSKLASIWVITRAVLEGTSGNWQLLAMALVVVFAVAWLVSILAALRTLLHVDNPAGHVAGERPGGVFYSAGLFRVTTWDALLPRRVLSSVEFDRFFAGLPQTHQAARRELAFELMKLVYIRTIKMKRAHLAYLTFYVWLASGGAIWLAQLAR